VVRVGTGDWSAFVERKVATPPAHAAARAAVVSGADVSDILFTSGTTGRSKGAMSSHRSSLSVARAWACHGGLTADDRYLVVNPFFHSFGWKAGILACLVSRAAMVPLPVFDPAAAMRVIEAERITVLPGAPTIYQTILDGLWTRRPCSGSAASGSPTTRCPGRWSSATPCRVTRRTRYSSDC
jgi:HIP---CoA ligase